MADKFRNKNGDLTAYAFACGYVQTKPLKDGMVRLFRDGACWHVQASNEQGRFIWESFNLLTPARAFFRTIKGKT